LPGIVGAEVPDVAFEVAAGVAAAAMALVVNVEDDLSAGGFGSSIMRVAIGDNDVAALRFGATDFVGLLHQFAKFVVLDGAEHDHAAAKVELCMGYGVVFGGNDEVFLETEGVAEPFNCGGSVAIAHAGDDG